MHPDHFPPSPNCTCPLPISTHLHLNLHLHRPHLRLKSSPFSLPKYQTQSTNIASLIFYPPTSCSNEEQYKFQTNNSHDLNPDHLSFDEIHSSADITAAAIRNPQADNQEQRQDNGGDNQIKKPAKRLFTNMWWADLKAALGQRINVEGIVCSASVFVKDRHLMLPHIKVPDIRYLDWPELHRRGFKGVVFDKDNTITVPYSLTLWGPLGSSIELCKSVFGNDVAVFSNSAGLYEYDHEGSKARALEKAVGIRVIRHKVKKPAGTAEEIEKHFGCKCSQLIMVGDRPFTDVVYGNRNGFFTILTGPLSLVEEPFIVRQVRKLEMALVSYWFRRGLKPTVHSLLSDGTECVKDPPLL